MILSHCNMGDHSEPVGPTAHSACHKYAIEQVVLEDLGFMDSLLEPAHTYNSKDLLKSARMNGDPVIHDSATRDVKGKSQILT